MKHRSISQSIRLFLRRTFDIHEGEQRRALLMQLNIFLIITTLLIVKPTVNGLFLSRFGAEQLPFAFILVAVVAAVVTGLYSRLLKVIQLKRMMFSTLVGSVGLLIAFGLLLYFNVGAVLVLYLFYIFVAIFALLTTSQFWVLANIVFNAREAKRLFGFIGAGAIGGGIFGGYLTSVLAESLSSEVLPLVAAVFLFGCIPVTNLVWREVGNKGHRSESQRTTPNYVDRPWRQIRQSKHLMYIAGIVGISVVVAKFVDYQFGGIAASLIPDQDELTAFFGFWFSTFNVISLLIQLFLTRKIVVRFGVSYSLFFLPVAILLAAVLLILFPELLMAAVFLKMADGGLKQSVNKAAMELLILPVPQVVKNSTKTFIDVFVDSLAAGLSGLILLFVVQGLNLSTLTINLMIISSIALWLFLVYRVRKEYFKSFRTKIGYVKNPKSKPELTDPEAIHGMIKALNIGNDHQILHLLEIIKNTPNQLYLDRLQSLVQHDNAAVRAQAIRNFYNYPKRNFSQLIIPLTSDPTHIVKMAVLDYILKFAADRKDIVLDYLNHKDYKIRCSSLVSVTRELRQKPKLKSQYSLEQLINLRFVEVERVEDQNERFYCTSRILRAIGYSGISRLYHYLDYYLANGNQQYIFEAIHSAGLTRHPQFIDRLIDLLSVDRLRSHTRNALLKYGKSIVPILSRNVKDVSSSLQIIRQIPSVVKRVNTQKSVDLLFKMLDYDDFMVRREALRGLNLLHNNNPDLSFNKQNVVHRILNETRMFQESLSVLHAQSQLYAKEKTNNQKLVNHDQIVNAREGLMRLLERRLDRNLERIFRLLGLKYTSLYIHTIYKGLHDANRTSRLNAIEFLDNLLEPSLKKVLIPIVETAMLEQISDDAIRDLNLRVPNELESLRILLNSHDLKIKQSVLFLISKLYDPKYLELLKKYKENCIVRLLDPVGHAIRELELNIERKVHSN